MNLKERFISSIKMKPVDRIPTSYRGVHSLTESLMKYFDINIEESPYDPKNRNIFLKKLGADIWSDTVRPDAFKFYRPKYKGPLPEKPYVPDSELFYALGIKCKSARVEQYNFEYSYIVFSIPKILGIYFLFNRNLLKELSKISWGVIGDYYRSTCRKADGSPAAVAVIQTFCVLG